MQVWESTEQSKFPPSSIYAREQKKCQPEHNLYSSTGVGYLRNCLGNKRRRSVSGIAKAKLTEHVKYDYYHQSSQIIHSI